ncbi:unnamed protein product [Bursaphelenchus okinawaensis]|uniref:G_PROTEIN_RECEP_F1_2 domain-containing protein n=1 Tax=Bursaphelenchus okinawaensis TaxID=465554 RepID=A0A811LTD4_9BILA|nr:unnamed protein product [Bursaphelenchus okinawaensis]CAG9127841.1 unnamed protein product [Bursaphelenchus okinawaensis]
MLEEWEMPSPQFLLFYHIYEIVMYFLSVSLTVLAVVVMVKSKSRTLKSYKWFLLNSMIWGFFFDSIVTTIGAFALFPIPCYVGTGVASNLHGNWQVAYFFVGVNALIGKSIAVALQLARRYIYSLPYDSVIRRYFSGSTKYEIKLRLSAYIAVCFFVNVTLIYVFPNQTQEKQYLLAADPSLATLFDNYPGMTCFSTGTNINFLLVPITILYSAAIMLYLCLYMVYRNVHRNGTHSSTTKNLQIMLFNSLCAQTVIITIMAFVPAFFFFVLPLLGVRNMPVITACCFMVLLAHTPSDCIMVLLFIAPFRKYLIKKWQQLWHGKVQPSDLSRNSITIM